MSLPVPATTSGGPGGDTGKGVSLSRALKESSTGFDVLEEVVYMIVRLMKLFSSGKSIVIIRKMCEGVN